MKIGDIVMIFANPMENKYPQGQARLHYLVQDYGELEYWEVEYLDHPDHHYKTLIRKDKNEKNKET